MNYSLTRLWKMQREARRQRVLDAYGEIEEEGSQ